jgi:hypothetical protein
LLLLGWRGSHRHVRSPEPRPASPAARPLSRIMLAIAMGVILPKIVIA